MVFYKDASMQRRTYSDSFRLRAGDREYTLHLLSYPLDETKGVLMITLISEEEHHAQSGSKKEKMDVFKSVYLFSMNVDLNADTCCNMDLSEVENAPVNALALAYSQWRATIVNMIYPDDQPAFNEMTDPGYLRENLSFQRSRSMDCQMMNLEGKFIWVKLIFHRVNTGDDDDFRFVFMVEDIHESHLRLMEDLKKYENLANKDSLTGLYNHGSIKAALTECLERCGREHKPVSLIMFDIDYFKKVNDSCGHDVGDQVLKAVAAMAQEDLSSHGGRLGRWGGDEFLGICEDMKAGQLAEIAGELRQKIDHHDFPAAGHLTGSFGIIEVRPGETPPEAFRRIDAALYRSKNGGRNRVIIGE